MKVGKTLGVVGLLAASSLAMEGCIVVDPPFDVACFVQPSGTVALNFTIDATARPGWYANEDLEWKGSFAFNKDTRMLEHDGSWSGPYAGLWDDGPWTEGTAPNCGHEPVGSVAGDNKFGITTFMTIPTAADVTIEYGAQTKEGIWIWTGLNGSVVVPMNASTAVTADGLTLPAPGNTDLKLMLDTKNLGSGFTYTPGQPIEVRGQMFYWLLEPTYDDGTHGDATSGDGLFTYTRTQLVGDTWVEFIWTINNVEYKTPNGACEMTGLSAMTNTADAGWVDALINDCRVWIP